MNASVALCSDAMSLEHPSMIGFEDLSFQSLPWLSTYSSGAVLRGHITRGVHYDQIWIIYSEDISSINLVAALRKDGYQGAICFVSQDANGSEFSRATSAGATHVYDLTEFVKAFALEVMRRNRMEEMQHAFHTDSTHQVRERNSAQPLTGNPRNHKDVLATAADNSCRLLPTQGSGFVLSVMPTCGGVGRTVFSACSAALLAQRGLRVLFIDAGNLFQEARTLFGDKTEFSIENVMADEKLLLNIANDMQPRSPAVISASSSLSSRTVGHEWVSQIVSAGTELFDVVIIDTPPLWSKVHVKILELSSCAVFLMDQRSSSVNACRFAIQLCSQLGMATQSLAFGLNRCKKGALFSALDISTALDGLSVYAIKDGGTDIEELACTGNVGKIASAHTPFSESLEEMLDALVPLSWERKFMKANSSASSHESLGFAKGWGSRHESRKRPGKGRRQKAIHIQRGVNQLCANSDVMMSERIKL